MLNFSVKAKSENDTKTIVSVRGFEMIVDEPKELGGTNDGANPVEYVLTALCGCLNVMGHIVAKELGFKLRQLSVDIEGDLDPAKFMGKPTEGRAGYVQVRATLFPECDADKDTLEKWLRIVEDRCPVSDNLSNATPLKMILG